MRIHRFKIISNEYLITYYITKRKEFLTMLSSLGFHTINIFQLLPLFEISQLIKDFINYSKKTGLIQIYTTDKTGKYLPYIPDDKTKPEPTNLIINYYKKDIGIKWNICYSNNDYYKIPLFSVSAKINPKILGGTINYLTAATWGDLNVAITNFNREAKRISPLLGEFKNYSLTRLDYCINFSINELLPGCDAEQIITLIKRSNIPRHYKEYMVYDHTSHRLRSKPGSFYIYNNSVTVNCYSKYIQLQHLSEENIKNNRPPVPEETLNKSKDIIRFEIQCKYPKAYTLSHKSCETNIHYPYKYMGLFTPDKCKEIITYYFKKIIGTGDWYSLSHAVSIIKSKNYNAQREQRLIETLKFINQCRSVFQASQYYTGKDYVKFLNTLKELNQININPVTIPQNWGIKHIPNLLNTYFYKKALTLSDNIFTQIGDMSLS